MDVRFRTVKLAKLCNSEKQAIRKWGKALTRKLQQRLFELQACGVLADMMAYPAARCHPLTGQRHGQFALRLQGKQRLIFVPDREPLPCQEDGDLDLSRISAIEIIEVVDYHG